MNLTLESLAALSLFLANVIVIIVVIATYWRMTRYEESNHIHIVNALRETREAGRAMKSASNELMRVAERGLGAGGGVAAGNLSPADVRGLTELPLLMRQLLNTFGMEAGSTAAQQESERLPWPEHASDMNEESLEALKRSHRNEVERMVAQRRRVQVELAQARERLEESSRLLNSFRSRTSQTLNDQAEINAARQRAEQARTQMQQWQEKHGMAETRAERAERTAARLQRELETLALNPDTVAVSAGEAAAADPGALKKLEREAKAQREQLAEAGETIEKLRRDLAVLSADPPQHDDAEAAHPSDLDEARSRLEKEIEQLNGRVEELEDSLHRNLVEKNFIEEHYLAETRKQREDAAALEQGLGEAAPPPIPALTPSSDKTA
ncbi:coiled-coil domain-containing protein [Roseateles oligotrophus]|uniref:Chromosome partition protein Smc n=1 Tax=Roseateles oligotrophus TaxID=1769250 RepID=A0ABT2YAM0_9BURK|nr:hypothetical protein [Roseateles oligotrophus]MCV2367351.1 hypothetical protein [Roseateles oligotrophus]